MTPLYERKPSQHLRKLVGSGTQLYKWRERMLILTAPKSILVDISIDDSTPYRNILLLFTYHNNNSPHTRVEEQERSLVAASTKVVTQHAS